MVSSPAPVATPKGRPGGGEIRVEPNELSPPGVVRRAPNRVAVAMAVWLVTPFAVAVTTVLLGWLGRDLLLHWFGISPLFVADSTGGWRPFFMYLYDLVLACTVFEGLGWVFVAGWCTLRRRWWPLALTVIATIVVMSQWFYGLFIAYLLLGGPI
jgi:hypothetical protein